MAGNPDNIEEYRRYLGAGEQVGDPDPRETWIAQWSAAEFKMIAAEWRLDGQQLLLEADWLDKQRAKLYPDDV